VDLGTGIRTALAQIVAEELDVAFERITMVLGDTARVPNQGPTIASESIQIAAVPIRNAAAQARQFLVARAAERFDVHPDELTVGEGLVRCSGNRSASYGELITGETFRIELADDVAVKPFESYKVVGKPAPRVDLVAKATGELTYVHDVRVPGMVHGRVVRPPYAGVDSGDFVGKSLISVNEASVADVPGMVSVVKIGDFVGVIAEREENAIEAAELLEVAWKPVPPIPDLKDIETALRANPSAPRTLIDRGDVGAAIAKADKRIKAKYIWPYQMHASIGPSCSVADYQEGFLRVWSGTQNPHVLRADLALLMQMDEAQIDIVRMEAAGCYGRNCADDVSADAALLSRAAGRPVRVQLTREQEHVWEPKGTGQLLEVDGGLNADGSVAAYDFTTRYPSNNSPTLALLLTKTISSVPEVIGMGDRTAIPPYEFDAMRVVVHDMPPIVRASWLRAVSALPNTFAHESYIDELAAEVGADPIEYRLRYLKDQRGIDLIREVAARAEWTPRAPYPRQIGKGDIVSGRGFAYALHIHGKFPGIAAAWSAWITDVTVNKNTGDVSVTRVVMGQDAGLVINPDGARHQIQGNVIQSTSRALMEEVSFDSRGVVSREWGAYPIIKFPDVPKIDVLLMPRQDQPPLGIGEASSIPSAAAIANAIFDATGVRFRELPFTPDRMRAGLSAAASGAPSEAKKRTGLFAGLIGACIAVAGFATMAMPWRSAIAPIPKPDATVCSKSTIERGRQLAALGNCGVCHTTEGNVVNAGGVAIERPFGIIYSTNITPDQDTGIGAWSYPAFERSVREGIHRDGRHLYPAFPYAHFAKTSDADLQALYAYLMSQSPVHAENRNSELAFPFGARPLVSVWNAAFHSAAVFQADPSKSETWNRGAYLVEGLGHCGACHTPRNLFGAERGGAPAHLGGAMVKGWEAPALNSLSHAPIPWTEEELFAYLRTGTSRFHGVAAGPMAPVVKELAVLPDSDIKAMANYIASFNADRHDPLGQETLAKQIETAAGARFITASSIGEKIHEGACAVCHQASAPELFGTRPSLALNSNLQSQRPDNLIQVILHGISSPVSSDLGYMPAFKNSLDDEQVVELVSYLRQKFAPEKQAWIGVPETVRRIRMGR
jgi:nicotinate dehydrogenase subunit B